MNKTHIAFGFIFLIGWAIRIWLSTLPYNVDIKNYMIDVEIFHIGGNIYKLQTAYNYSPVWYWILGLLDTLRLNFFTTFSFPFIVRIFLSFIDGIILATLVYISTKRKVPVLYPLLLFFLNPISMIISAKHGQFDNLALLFLIFAWIASQKKNYRLVWILGTASLLVKHTTLFPLMTLYWGIWGFRRGIMPLFGSIFVFAFSFAPYISAWKEIIQNVFLYGGVPGEYGISSVLTWMYRIFAHPVDITMNSSVVGAHIGVRSVYVILSIGTIIINTIFTILISRRVSVWRSMLYSTIFFLITTTGIGIQYFILPLVFAWADQKIPTIVYTIIVTLFFMGNSLEFGLSQFSFVTWNFVWVTLICWLLYMKCIVEKNVSKYE